MKGEREPLKQAKQAIREAESELLAKALVAARLEEWETQLLLSVGLVRRLVFLGDHSAATAQLSALILGYAAAIAAARGAAAHAGDDMQTMVARAGTVMPEERWRWLVSASKELHAATFGASDYGKREQALLAASMHLVRSVGTLTTANPRKMRNAVADRTEAALRAFAAGSCGMVDVASTDGSEVAS